MVGWFGDSFLGIDLAMSHSLEGRVGDTAPVCRATRAPFTAAHFTKIPVLFKNIDNNKMICYWNNVNM